MQFRTPVKASEPNFGDCLLKHFLLFSENWEWVCFCVYVPVRVHVFFACKYCVTVKKVKNDYFARCIYVKIGINENPNLSACALSSTMLFLFVTLNRYLTRYTDLAKCLFEVAKYTEFVKNFSNNTELLNAVNYLKI